MEKKPYKSFDERKKPKSARVTLSQLRPSNSWVVEPDYSNAAFKIGDKVQCGNEKFMIQDIDVDVIGRGAHTVVERFFYLSHKKRTKDGKGTWYPEDALTKQPEESLKTRGQRMSH